MNLYTKVGMSRDREKVCYEIACRSEVSICNLTCLLQTEHFVVGSNFNSNEGGIFSFHSVSANVKN
jgi:hypothetical protein